MVASAAGDPDAPSPSEREMKMQPERGLVAGRGEAPGQAAARLEPLFKESPPGGGGRAEPHPGWGGREPGVSPPTRLQRMPAGQLSAGWGGGRGAAGSPGPAGAGGDLRAPPAA